MSTINNSSAPQTKLLWIAIALLGAVAFAIVALNRGEAVNAAWLVVAAVCIYFIAYRFYGLFVANRALGVDGARQTPAARHNDGLDYVPTNQYVLFGHHFAAIAGAGPLVGPVLAAQMGYLPGTLWILAGAVFAGAVQDMTVLFLSTRRDGRSLGDIVRAEMGPVAGTITGIGILLICVIVLAVLALVVVKALIGSPWGTFAVFCTIPIALLMGVYNQFIRPGRVGEMSLLGCVLLLAALVYGKTVSETPALAAYFDLQRGDTRADHHRIRFRRIRAAGLVASGPARLSFDIPEDRHHRAPGRRHHHRSSRSPDAGRHQVHRRQRTCLVWRRVPVPVHYHRVRRRFRMAFAHCVRDDTEDDRERKADRVHRLRRNVDGIVRRHNGDDRREHHPSRRLFCNEQLRRD